MVKKRLKRRCASTPALVGDEIHKMLETMGGSRERAKIADLWPAWSSVLGEELAYQMDLLGHKGPVLRIGVEDALLIQELSFQQDEILIKVNAFMGSAYFSSIRFEVSGKSE